MSVTVRPFGATRDGTPVRCFRMEAPDGAYAEVLDYGATLRAVCVPDKENTLTDVCLGFDDVAGYEDHDAYLGALVGRCANRIRNARFRLSDKEYHLADNQAPSHLHGGVRGFDKYVWDGCVDGEDVVLTRLSPDGEEGYPGNLRVEVRYTFTPAHALHIALSAETDADTVVNLTSHAYWNLEGHGAGSVGDHRLKIDATAYTEMESDCCPSGVLAAVVGTPFDLREAKPLSAGWDAGHPQIRIGGGYDHNWAIRGAGLREAAVLTAPGSGITMALSTTQPGLQVYTANGMGKLHGKGGALYGYRRAVALEAQGYPDAVNQPTFPSTLLRAGEAYRQEIIFTFSRCKGAV